MAEGYEQKPIQLALIAPDPWHKVELIDARFKFDDSLRIAWGMRPTEYLALESVKSPKSEDVLSASNSFGVVFRDHCGKNAAPRLWQEMFGGVNRVVLCDSYFHLISLTSLFCASQTPCR